jgi:hypothetical protein
MPRGIAGFFEFGIDAGWSSLVARRAHNPKVVGSNPAPATNIYRHKPCAYAERRRPLLGAFYYAGFLALHWEVGLVPIFCW